MIALALLFLGVVYGVVAGFLVLDGRDFRYFIFGGLLQRFLRMRAKH